MKKGDATGLVIIISVIAIIIIITQYLIFFVVLPNKSIQVDIKEYIEEELDLTLMTFVKLNSDLIVKSIKNNNYAELEKEINKLEFDKCWEIKIQDKIFNKNNCKIKDPNIAIQNIPDYNNNQIKIELNVNKK